MSRYFMIQSWVGSHENEPDYNGQQCGERNVRSIEAVPLYDQFGNANVSAFSDEAIAARKGKSKPTGIPIADRILPQKRRLSTLHGQMLELENSYRSGEMDISEYSLLRDIIVAKIQRQEVLYKRAASVKPKSEETDEDYAQDSLEYTAASGFSPQGDDGYTSEESEEIGVVWIDELSETNSLKNILKKACVMCRTLVRWHQASKRYIQTLKDV